MNTKQLVAFWYTGIAIIVVLIGFAYEKPDYSIWLFLASIITFGALFIYSFAAHPNANKKVVVTSVGIPSILVISTIFIIANNNFVVSNSSTTENTSKITKEQVELFDTKLYSSSGRSTIKGRIRNLSKTSLSSITLRVNIREEGKLIDGKDVFIYFQYNRIPPNGVQSFEESFYGIYYPENWTWNYTIKQISP